MEVTWALGAAMLVAAGVETHYHNAVKKLEASLKSGKPLEIFKAFIAAQGGEPGVCDHYALLPQSKHQVAFTAEKDGYISKINAYEVGMTAVDIGAGRKKREDVIDHSAGFVFHKKSGDRVNRGEPVLTIHTNHSASIPRAQERLRKAITIVPRGIQPQDMILYRVDKSGIHPWKKE